MQETNPIEEARQAINKRDAEKNEASTSQSQPPNNDDKKGSIVPFIVGGILAIVLVFVGLFLFLGQSMGLFSDEVVEGDDPEIAPTAEMSDLSTSIAGEIEVTGAGGVSSVPAADFAELSSLPAGASAKSNVYAMSEPAMGMAAVTVPNGIAKTDDLFGWDGSAWRFVPSQHSDDGQQLITAEGMLPQALVVASRSEPENVSVAANVSAGAELAPEMLPSLSMVNVGGLMLAGEGQLQGEPAAVPQGGYAQMLHVTNVGAIVDQSALSELLANADLRTSHMQLLVNAVTSGNYAGLNLDYQGVLPAQREAFTLFATDLANNLEAQGKQFAITVATPTRNSDGTWATGGQDLTALSDIADTVYLNMPLDPTAYVDEGLADEMLGWATRQMDRGKVVAQLSTKAIDKLGGVLREVPLAQALTNLGELNADVGERIDTGMPVEVALAGEATPLVWDGESLTHKFTYEKDGQTRTVWVSNESALAYRLRLAERYGLQGVSVNGLADVNSPEAYLAALASYTADGEVPQPVAASIAWVVTAENGDVVASESGEKLNYTWEGTEYAGDYTIQAGFSQGEKMVTLGELPVTVGTAAVAEAPTTETEDAEKEPEADAATETKEGEEGSETAETKGDGETESAEAGEDSKTEGATETATPSGDGNAVVNVGANVRLGPGLTYGTIAGGAENGTSVEVIGRSQDSLWFNIVLPDGQEGWIFNTLVDLNASVDVAGLPVPAVAAAPAAPAAPANSGGGETASAAPAAPAPVAAPANLGGGFELGGQTHSFANPTLMSYSGMKWVKFQHKWGCGNNPGDVAGRIQQAQANGFKVLLSMPGSPYPSSIDFQCYVDFLGGVAALGPNAIEVWNEMNIDFEWPAGQIDPVSYVNNMLAPAYNAIKSANPNVMVISGAPAPTGFFGGGCAANGCDDNAYLSGMAAAGAANYMDCMGAHYNAGATSPHQPSGHPAGNDHYSWHLQPMINLYYGALGRPVCFTELGYVSGEDYGGVPSRFNWAGGTTIAQHAQWLAEAVSISANSGKVRMVIVFNVDFTTYGEDPQAGFAMIRRNGSCPACESLRQVMGGG